MGNSKITARTIKMTFQLRETGASLVEIGRTLGISDKTVAAILHGRQPHRSKTDYETIIKVARRYALTPKGQWERKARQEGGLAAVEPRPPDANRLRLVFCEKSKKLPLNTSPPIPLIKEMLEDFFLREKQ